MADSTGNPDSAEIFTAQRVRLLVWAVPLLAGVGYGLLAWLCPPQAFWSGDGGIKLLQIQGLIESRGRSLALPYPARPVDPQQRHFPIGLPYAAPRDGAWYSTFPPFFAFATLPFYLAIGMRGLYVLPLAAGVASVALSQRLAERLGLSSWWQMYVGLAVALATPLGFYSATFWEHAPATALSLAGLVLVLPAMGGAEAMNAGKPLSLSAGRVRCTYAGVCWGAAAALRLETLALPPAALLAAAFCSRSGRPSVRTYVGAVALGWLVPVTALALLNVRWFGHPLGLVSEHFRPGSGGADATRGQILWQLLVDDHTQGFQAALLPTFPIAAVGAFAVVVGFFSRGGSSVDRQRQRFLCEALVLWLTATLLLVPNPGGAQYAGRYLLPMLPALIVVLASLVRRSAGFIRMTIAALAIYSAFHGCLGAYRLWHLTNRIEGPMVAWVSRQPVDAVLVHHPFFAQQAAALFADKPMLAITGAEGDEEVLAALRKHGWRRLLLAGHAGTRRDRGLLRLRDQVTVYAVNDTPPPDLRFRGYFFELWLLDDAEHNPRP